jgi:hypothetical protein
MANSSRRTGIRRGRMSVRTPWSSARSKASTVACVATNAQQAPQRTYCPGRMVVAARHGKTADAVEVAAVVEEDDGAPLKVSAWVRERRLLLERTQQQPRPRRRRRREDPPHRCCSMRSRTAHRNVTFAVLCHRFRVRVATMCSCCSHGAAALWLRESNALTASLSTGTRRTSGAIS